MKNASEQAEQINEIVKAEKSLSIDNLRKKLNENHSCNTILNTITKHCPQIYENDEGMLIFDDGTDYPYSPAS